MSKIEELIQRLCPNGVKWKTMEEVFEFRNGYTPSKSNPDFWTDGTIPWFRMEDIRTNGRILSDSIQHITLSAIKGAGLFEANSFILATTATIGEHALIIADSLANQQFTNLKIRKSLINQIDIKYMFHYMFIIDDWCKEHTNVSGFASVDMKGLKKLPIPLPPIEVQNEIVRILDSFTSLTAELKAELKARREQYEYYRNELLSFERKENVRWMTIDRICTVYTGGELSTDNLFSKEYTRDTPYPIYANGLDTYGYTNTYRIDKDAVCISSIGANTGAVFFKKAFFTPIIRLKVLVPFINTIETKYLYYALSCIKVKCKGNGGIPNINANDVKKIVIPVPSLAEQERIVSILDKFEALVNDLSQGLPAEIVAVQEQYEYYRNKLLTFQRAS